MPVDVDDLLVEQVLAQQEQSFIRLEQFQVLPGNPQTDSFLRQDGNILKRRRERRLASGIFEQQKRHARRLHSRNNGQLLHFPGSLPQRVDNGHS